MCSEVCYCRGTSAWRKQKAVLTEGGGSFWRREESSPWKRVTWHVKERTGVEVSVPVIQERKREGQKVGESQGRRKQIIQYLLYSFFPLGIFNASSMWGDCDYSNFTEMKTKTQRITASHTAEHSRARLIQVTLPECGLSLTIDSLG